jgi:nicotinate dehydrogenase subunit A
MNSLNSNHYKWRNFMTVSLTVNGARHSSPAAPDTPLLYVLRNDLGINSPKYGCGVAQCGACTVLLDGQPVRSCNFPASSAEQRSVTTLEGLGNTQKLHALQKAFIDEQAVQCGYCIPGMIMSAKALLDKTRNPSEAQIKEALAANLCRCGTHNRIVRAVQRAAKEMA